MATPTKYEHKPLAFALQKHSPFLGVFNFYLKQMQEKGTLKQIKDKYEIGTQLCPDLSGKPLEFGAVFTAFLLLAFGTLMALLILLVEKIVTKFF